MWCGRLNWQCREGLSVGVSSRATAANNTAPAKISISNGDLRNKWGLPGSGRIAHGGTQPHLFFGTEHRMPPPTNVLWLVSQAACSLTRGPALGKNFGLALDHERLKRPSFVFFGRGTRARKLPIAPISAILTLRIRQGTTLPVSTRYPDRN